MFCYTFNSASRWGVGKGQGVEDNKTGLRTARESYRS